MRRAIILLGLMVFEPVWASELVTTPSSDSQESVKHYAERTNLALKKKIVLGNGLELEVTLIPPGKFIMGTPQPDPPNNSKLRAHIMLAKVILLANAATILIILGAIIAKAILRRQRPRYSLLSLLVLTISVGSGILVFLYWQQSESIVFELQTEYNAALNHYHTADNAEKPEHNVTITNPFYIGTFDVTQEEYQQVMGSNPSTFKGGDYPVETVSWTDAVEFCRKLCNSRQLVRLPTEAEWEYSCRAGTKSVFYTGNCESDMARAGWYGEKYNGGPHPVGQKESNAFGLYDMHGNVCQWCQDWLGEYPTGNVSNPIGPTIGKFHIIRGGYWCCASNACASSARSWEQAASRYIGFRVVALTNEIK